MMLGALAGVLVIAIVAWYEAKSATGSHRE